MRTSGKIVAGLLVLPVLLALGYAYMRREPDKPRFYVDNDLESDVWKLPLVEPHYLIATEPYNAAARDYARWAFQENENLFHPDSLNYQPGFITFYDSNQHQYGFYDLTQDTTVFLGSYKRFAGFARSAGLRKVLYDTEQVYRCWQQTRQLPWAKEIFLQHYGSTLHE